jgi:hypothetical protein
MTNPFFTERGIIIGRNRGVQNTRRRRDCEAKGDLIAKGASTAIQRHGFASITGA